MVIKYKLIPNKGIKETPDTVILDIDSQIELSFSLASGKELTDTIAVFIGQDGKEHKQRLKDGKCEMPKSLLKPQLVQLYLIELKDGKISNKWNCQPFKIINLSEIGKMMFQVVEDYPAIPQDVKDLQVLCGGLIERLDKVEAENLSLRQQLERKQEDIRAEISKDVAGLMDYKRLNIIELKKIMEGHNSLSEEVSKIKSEFSL